MGMFSQMATFVRVVDIGSLSGAARVLHLSLPAVSRQLRALETELGGGPLLIRSSRGLQMTGAGQRFYAEAVSILRSVDRARARVKDGDELAGRLVVSIAISVGLEVIVPRVTDLLAAHRSLQLEIRLEDRLVDLIGEGVDVAIRAGVAPPDSTGYMGHVLGGPAWRFAVAAPSYLRRRGRPTTVTQLASHDCLVHLGPAGPNRRLTFEREKETVDVELHSYAVSNAALVLRQFALAGLGISILPDWLVEDDLREGRLRRVLPDWRNGPSYTYAFHRVELRSSPHVRALIDALRPVTTSRASPSRQKRRDASRPTSLGLGGGLLPRLTPGPR